MPITCIIRWNTPCSYFTESWRGDTQERIACKGHDQYRGYGWVEQSLWLSRNYRHKYIGSPKRNWMPREILTSLISPTFTIRLALRWHGESLFEKAFPYWYCLRWILNLTVPRIESISTYKSWDNQRNEEKTTPENAPSVSMHDEGYVIVATFGDDSVLKSISPASDISSLRANTSEHFWLSIYRYCKTHNTHIWTCVALRVSISHLSSCTKAERSW